MRQNEILLMVRNNDCFEVPRYLGFDFPSTFGFEGDFSLAFLRFQIFSNLFLIISDVEYRYRVFVFADAGNFAMTCFQDTHVVWVIFIIQNTHFNFNNSPEYFWVELEFVV